MNRSIDSKIFSVIHGTEKYNHDFSSEVNDNLMYQVFVRGGCSDTKTDFVWLNYGQNKFVNKIPIGYKPWVPLCQKKTCKIMHRYMNPMLSFGTLLIIS